MELTWWARLDLDADIEQLLLDAEWETEQHELDKDEGR